MAKKWHQGSLIKILDESPTTRRFWIKVEEEETPFSFRAGQFITMDLPVGETRLDRWRSYSIANAPDETNILELCIVNLEGGRASKYFFEDIDLGQSFKFKGPAGVFTLPKILEKELVFICTGTGIAPFRSMILDLIKQEEELPKIHLIFGTRTAEGILYRKEIEELLNRFRSLKFSVALSRESDIDKKQFSFNVHEGYVHNIYKKTYNTPKSNITFYLCGWSNMVDEAQSKLTEEMGYSKDQVILELYG